MSKTMYPLERNLQSASPRPLLECFSNRRRLEYARRRQASQKDLAKLWVIALEAASKPPYSEMRSASAQVFQQRRGDFVSEGQPKQSSGLALLYTNTPGPSCYVVQCECHNVATAQAVGGDQEKDRVIADSRRSRAID